MNNARYTWCPCRLISSKSCHHPQWPAAVAARIAWPWIYWNLYIIPVHVDRSVISMPAVPQTTNILYYWIHGRIYYSVGLPSYDTFNCCITNGLRHASSRPTDVWSKNSYLGFRPVIPNRDLRNRLWLHYSLLYTLIDLWISHKHIADSSVSLWIVLVNFCIGMLNQGILEMSKPAAQGLFWKPGREFLRTSVKRVHCPSKITIYLEFYWW